MNGKYFPASHMYAALYILLLEEKKGVNIWGVNICDAGQYNI